MTMKIEEELGGGDAPLLNQVIVLSDGRCLDGRLGLDGLAGASLGPREKLAFMASNLPYVATALWIWWAGQTDPIPAQAGACLGDRCSSASFHAGVVACMAAVSSYWHGAQCQLGRRADGSIGVLGWLYGRQADGTVALHAQRWLGRLVVCDILASLSMVGIGFCCFGPVRTLSWITPALVAFVLGSRAKRRREFRAYALFHGLWHCLSAISISQIVLNARPLFDPVVLLP